DVGGVGIELLQHLQELDGVVVALLRGQRLRDVLDGLLTEVVPAARLIQTQCAIPRDGAVDAGARERAGQDRLNRAGLRQAAVTRDAADVGRRIVAAGNARE